MIRINLGKAAGRTHDFRPRTFLAWLILWIAVAAVDAAGATQPPANLRDPASVALAYLRAVYSRDFAEAYRYVSSADRRVKSLDQYLRQRGVFSGFSLEVAKRLAAQIEIETSQTPMAANRIRITANYKAPDPEKLAPLLRDWNGYQLNALSSLERKRIIQTIEQQKHDGTLEMLHGVERLVLISEGGEWRIFLDWAAGVTIPFRIVMPEPAGTASIDVKLSRQHLVARPGEVFEIVLQIKNRTGQPIVARIGHVVEPQELADYLEFVQCGFLLPVRLEPGTEQEYSGTYLLRGSLPEGVRELKLSYDFKLDEAK